MASEIQIEASVGTVALLGGLLIAWWATRSYDASRPGPAVRLYLLLFSLSNLKRQRDSAESTTRYPRREAFLATWFLVFFGIFMFGISVWPSLSSR